MKEKRVLTQKELEYISDRFDGVERIEKDASLSWDGRNLLLRLPKDIANYFKINEKNRKGKAIKFVVEEKNGIVKNSFLVVDRDDR